MVDDGQYAVVASAFQKSGDQIHGHLGERGVVVRYRDFVQGGLRFVCEILVLLADCAPFDVALDPGASFRPTETVKDLSGSFVSAWVSRQSIVVGVHDAPLGFFIQRDDCFLVLIEP